MPTDPAAQVQSTTVRVGAPTRLIIGGLAVLVFSAGLIVDQLTKSWALQSLADGSEVQLLPGISLRLAFNPGMAFGLGSSIGPAAAVAIIVFLAALSSWICWNILRGPASRTLLLLAMVAAGGWGNIYDRITRADSGPLSGTVVDMIAVEGFAIFNVADTLAVCGIVAWSAVNLFGRRAARSEIET